MTRRPTIVLPHPSVDAAEWATLLASRSDDGTVDPNTVAHVFRNVELNPEMIRHIESVLLEAKISIAKIPHPTRYYDRLRRYCEVCEIHAKWLTTC